MTARSGPRGLSVGLAALVFAGPLAAAPPDKGHPLSSKEVYQRTLKSTTWVLPVDEVEGATIHFRSSGSGSLIDIPARLILTNYHVVRDKEYAFVFFPSFKDGKLIAERDFYRDQLKSGAGLRGKVVARDPKRDLALIQLAALPPGAQALKLASESVGPAETVHSIGNPGASGALWVYTPGSVKAVYPKKFTAGAQGSDFKLDIEATVVETTSPVNPGDSGGPLVNDRGELVAVTQGGIFSADTRGISYFIDVSEVRAVLKSAGLAKLAAAPKVSGPPTPAAPAATATAGPVGDTDKNERAAANILSLYQGDLRSPDARTRDKAAERLQGMIDQYPDTKAAAQAKELLKKPG
jgi:S1-C subfamily serine protease